MKLGIIGCGNMGSALARGILSRKILPFNNIYISDKDISKVKSLNKKFGMRISTNEEIVRMCNLIILAVKPQDSRSLLSEISDKLSPSAHLVSVMAGVTTSRIRALVKKKVSLTRAMPNMAALAEKSITCLCHNKLVKDKSMVNRIFSSIGEVVEIDEKYMDAVTAVSGSGPAYFFFLAEALRDAAVKLGINEEVASQLATATLVGSGALIDSLKLHPEVLRERITSKKGTTEAALSVFKSKEMKKLIAEAVKKAAQRSRELSRGV